MGRRPARNSTRRKQQRALDSRKRALDALAEGLILRVSNATNIRKGTVHSGLARRLVAEGRAYREYRGSVVYLTRPGA